MTNFSYTHTLDSGFSSSVVDEAYYNADAKALLIDLNDSLYLYDNVPLSAWLGLMDADSKGTYYANVIKPTYGKAVSVGTYGDVSYKKVADIGIAPKSTVRPSWERERDSTGRFVSSKPTPLGSIGAVASQELNGVSESNISSLTNVPNAEVKKFALNSVTDDVTKVHVSQRYSVKFVINGVDKTHNLNALSVDDAVAELTKSANALGLGIKVKEVTVYFD